MRQFLIRIIGFGLFCAVLIGGVSIGIDPYNVFHSEAIRDNGVEPDKNYIKMKYILANPDKYDSFIFGSSRVGAIFPGKMEGQNCYNMTYSMGLPVDHYENLQTLVENGVIPKRVYIGIDSLSYTMSPVIHDTTLYQFPYEKSVDTPVDFWMPYLDASMALDSLNTSYGHKKDKLFAEEFYTYGCWSSSYKKPKDLKYLKDGAFIGTDDFREEVLHLVSQIAELCSQNGIELVLFTNPMHHLTYTASVDSGWYDFLRGLSYITDFYNFSGLNAITKDDYNYVDTSHYVGGVGDLMIDRMENYADTQTDYGKSFGYYVTKDNVDELIRVLKEEAAENESL